MLWMIVGLNMIPYKQVSYESGSPLCKYVDKSETFTFNC